MKSERSSCDSVIAADGLYKRDVFSQSITTSQAIASIVLTYATIGFPDPFAVATIGGEQTRTTSVIKKTLNPYWNESFDMYGHLAVLLTLRDIDRK